MAEGMPGEERRMVVQQLDVWRHARGDDGPMPMKTALEHEFVDIAPSSFVLEVSGDHAEPTFISIGATISELQGGDLVGRSVSAADPQSLVGLVLQSLPVVLSKKVPTTISGDFEQVSGQKLAYRCILMPLSAASEKINIILGAVSFKTE